MAEVTPPNGAPKDMPPPPTSESAVSKASAPVESTSSKVNCSTSAGTAPRMIRMYSLKQLTDRYAPPAALPPTLHISTDVQASASPSTSRLRLPPSALTRSLSSQGSVASPAPVPFGSSPMTEKTSGISGDDPSASEIAGSSTAGDGREAAGAGFIKGYKSVPTLADIRKRVGSISTGSGPDAVSDLVLEAADAKKEVAASDTKTAIEPTTNPNPPALTDSANRKEHPLQHAWTMYFDSKSYKPVPPDGAAKGNAWESNLVTVGTFETVEGFARYLNNVRNPSMLAKHSNYHVFKDGIKPMWEDPANANGGKWVLLVRNGSPMLDSAWADVLLSLIGEQLDPDDEVCGVVVSTRPKLDRIQLWLRSSDDVEKANAVAKRLLTCLGLEGKEDEGFGLDFQYNASDNRPSTKSFLSIPFTNTSNNQRQADLPARPAPMWRSASASSISAVGSPLAGSSRIPSKV